MAGEDRHGSENQRQGRQQQVARDVDHLPPGAERAELRRSHAPHRQRLNVDGDHQQAEPEDEIGQRQTE